ncbi:MAG: DUF58 domain-containing protein [Planctomycetota bacterium]
MDEDVRRGLSEGEVAGTRYRLTAMRQTPAGRVGMHLGHRVGNSIEFMDYREYKPGDDLRRVDWSVYARSDRLTVKLYREEVSPHLDLLVDASRSMAVTASPKARASAALAAALSTAAGNAKFTHALYQAGDRVTPVQGGAGRPGGWQGLDFAGREGLDAALRQSPPAWRRRGTRVVISDLLFETKPLPVVQQLGRDAAGLCIVQLLGQCDVTPPARGNLRLVDSETGQVREIYIDAAAEKRYLQKLQNHHDAWYSACRQVGATLVQLIAEPLLASWDLSPLVEAGVLQVK